MKPRLIKINKIWHCRGVQAQFIGLGFTPLEAYRDWVAWNSPRTRPVIVSCQFLDGSNFR